MWWMSSKQKTLVWALAMLAVIGLIVIYAFEIVPNFALKAWVSLLVYMLLFISAVVSFFALMLNLTRSSDSSAFTSRAMREWALKKNDGQGPPT